MRTSIFMFCITESTFCMSYVGPVVTVPVICPHICVKPVARSKISEHSGVHCILCANCM